MKQQPTEQKNEKGILPLFLKCLFWTKTPENNEALHTPLKLGSENSDTTIFTERNDVDHLLTLLFAPKKAPKMVAKIG